MSDIESHMDLPWDWECISRNPNLTMTMIEAHRDERWSWGLFIMHIKLTVNILRQYPDEPWDFNLMLRSTLSSLWNCYYQLLIYYGVISIYLEMIV